MEMLMATAWVAVFKNASLHGLYKYVKTPCDIQSNVS